MGQSVGTRIARCTHLRKPRGDPPRTPGVTRTLYVPAGVTNGAAFGVGVGIGFALSFARLALWASPLRPKRSRGKLIVFAATFLLPAVAAFAMPTFKTGLLLWLGNVAGVGIATPFVLPLARVLLRKRGWT